MTTRYKRPRFESRPSLCGRKYRPVVIFVTGVWIGSIIATLLHRRTQTKVVSPNRHTNQPGPTILTTTTNVMIVLGEMLVNGTEATVNLKNRIRTAWHHLERRRRRNVPSTTHVIFSGGDTARVNKTEALVMKELWEAECESSIARRDSTSQSRTILHLEQQSLSTCQNAYYCIPILQRIRQEEWPNLLHTILVTSDYHVARAQLLFEQVFQTVFQQQNDTPIIIVAIDNVVGAPTIDQEQRQRLFQNEKRWIQPNNLKLLLNQMDDHPFQLPTTVQIRKASLALDRRERDGR